RGALAWPDAVRMAFIQHEPASGPVIQQDPRPPDDLAASETGRQARDIRHEVPLGIGDAKVRRVAHFFCQRPRRHLGLRVPGIEGAPPARSIVLGEESVQRVIDEPGIAQIRNRSANASFFASAIRCTASAVPQRNCSGEYPSMMFSISSTMTPCDGGAVVQTV